ncbi:hypothetical protein Enr13x_35810 [Stieleria neptunia]|uniref:Uncharacterized protein n=1 Tax=Stieleria neptunia TaxID=2527979 RepID=A0A518HS97_9BACT|nr:hypothetical protein [Stieleria neptunia]QDV43723.1 hypothetical protein Enr13x_35810 [Stieleria neptunia]
MRFWYLDWRLVLVWLTLNGNVVDFGFAWIETSLLNKHSIW